VDVGCDGALLDGELGRTAEAKILANGADSVLDGVGNRLVGTRIRGGCNGLGLAAIGERHLGDIGDDLLEGSVAGNEVGLGIDLDDRRLTHAGIDADEPFGRGTAGLLVGLGDALLAQPVDGLFHVAVGLVQRHLAVHHARAGQVAEFFDLCSRNAHCRLFV
jgi:hypothetical protein